MNRRELLELVAKLTGAAVMGGEAFFVRASEVPSVQSDGIVQFTAREINLLDEIAETIIPKTDTPGAKAAKVGSFMEVMVRDCYTTAQQQTFATGLKIFPQRCLDVYGKSFFSISNQQRHDYLMTLAEEAKSFNVEQQERDKERRLALETENRTKIYAEQKEYEALPRHFFTMLKQLTLLGFFTSQTGMTRTLRYVPIPGRYDGNVPYAKGQRAWA